MTPPVKRDDTEPATITAEEPGQGAVDEAEAEADWTRVQELFLEASEVDPGQQEAFLLASPEPEALVEEVRRMLQADRAAPPAIEGRLLADRAQGATTDTVEAQDTVADWIGRRIGVYRVCSLLGEGGMGQVFEARRDDRQFEQRVAIKVLRRQAVADQRASRRFDLERQLLARLEHPNIARLLDGGELDDGTPYLVMHYVEGQPIDRFCNAQRLSVGERLRLFLDVCAAVQFAHSNLVIHRDLKPGNILVESPVTTLVDSSSGAPRAPDRHHGPTDRDAADPTHGAAPGRVRLLDFGIAKLLEPEALDVSLLLTQASYRPMTPLYAAPEQFAGEPLTTATDAYALGALLFELLTGETPHDTSGSARAFEERVRTSPPRSLTAALDSVDNPDKNGNEPPASVPGGDDSAAAPRQSLAERAHSRATTPDGLHRALRGDLERIVAKALQRDPERRYQTAGDLADDLSRYLRGEAISVRDDTMGYRLRVFLRRNRALAAAVGTFVLALMLLSALLLRQTFVAQRAVARADAESLRSRAVASTLVDLFSSADAREGPTGGEISVAEFLERMERSADELEGDPVLHAEVLAALGEIYSGREESLRAFEVLERAARVHQSAEPDADQDSEHLHRQLRLEHQAARAAALVDQERGLEQLASSLERHRRAYGDNDPRTLAVALDHASHQTPTTALATLDRIEAEMAAAFGSDSPQVAQVLRERGEMHAWASQHEEARVDYRRALAIFEQSFGTDHPETLETLGELVQSLTIPSNLAPLRQLLERQERVFGTESGPVGETLDTLGMTLVRQGEMEGAAEVLGRAAKILRRVHGETSVRTLNTTRNAAIVASMVGQYASGIEPMRRFVEHVATSRSRNYGAVQLAFLEARAGPSPANLQRCAREVAARVAELDAERTGSADRYPGEARVYLAKIHLAAGEPEAALRHASDALADRLDDERPMEARIAQARFFVARAEAALGRAGSTERLRAALEQYASWGLHERLEAQLAREQLGE